MLRPRSGTNLSGLDPDNAAPTPGSPRLGGKPLSAKGDGTFPDTPSQTGFPELSDKQDKPSMCAAPPPTSQRAVSEHLPYRIASGCLISFVSWLFFAMTMLMVGHKHIYEIMYIAVVMCPTAPFIIVGGAKLRLGSIKNTNIDIPLYLGCYMSTAVGMAASHMVGTALGYMVSVMVCAIFSLGVHHQSVRLSR